MFPNQCEHHGQDSVRSLAGWRPTVARKPNLLTYDEKRRALEAMGVHAHVWRDGAERVVGDVATPHDR